MWCLRCILFPDFIYYAIAEKPAMSLFKIIWEHNETEIFDGAYRS